MAKNDPLRYLRTGTLLTVALFTFGLLVIGYSIYLQRLDAYSIFLPTPSYFAQCMRVPGGLLTWCATFLTQFFYYPWLGAALYALLLTALVLLIAKAFALPRPLFPIAAVPPLLGLLALLQLGYLIFSLKSPGIAYTPLLGCAASAALFWGFRCVRNGFVRLGLLLVLLFGGYPLLGSYALFAALLCVAAEAAGCLKARALPLSSAAIAALGSVAIFAVPRLWITHVGGLLMEQHRYTAPLPRFYEGEGVMWIPYLLAGLLLLALALRTALRGEQAAAEPRHGKRFAAIALLVLLVPSGAILFHRQDANFRTTIALQQALQEQQWARATAIAERLDEEPTRLNVLLGHMSLLRQGTAAERMFTLPNGAAPYRTLRAGRALADGGVCIVSYHLGRINYAYHWAMEYHVERGMQVEQLQFLAKCALLNGEYALAQRYLHPLSRTLFHRRWARRYRQYALHPERIGEDAELASIARLMPDRNRLANDCGSFEGYLLPTLSGTTLGSAELLDLALQYSLIYQDLKAFITKLPSYARTHRRLPKHYQEAVVLEAYMNGHAVDPAYSIDPQVESLFRRFLQFSTQYINRPKADQARLLKPLFGKTYWYYYSMMDDLKVI